MKQIGSMQFQDSISNENSYITVRVAERQIGIAVSQEHNGDVEVFLSVEQCLSVINWLNEARLTASSFEQHLP